MLALATLFGSAVLALSPTMDPRPDVGPCTGSAPPSGAVIRGPVLHVLDGVTLCVAMGATPDMWVPVELVDARKGSAAPGLATRRTLMAAAFARDVTCDVLGVSHGRTIAHCRVDGRFLSERIHEPVAIRAGLSWR